MSNWKNVNNWHWVNKNCYVWAQKWFSEQVVGIQAEKEGNKVAISKVSELTGDVDLNQRKGKIITIYDIDVKLSWEGALADGTEVKGTIRIPEIAHDTDEDDYVFELTIQDDNNAKQPIKTLIRKEIQPLLVKKFKEFSPAMIKDNCEDVYIEAQKMGSASPARLPVPNASANGTSSSAATTTAAATTTTASSNGPKAINTVTLNDVQEFQTSADELYFTLTDAQRASAWTRGHVKLEPKAGALFEFFNGNVTGEFLEVVPGKKIIQTWRLRSWPAGHHSKVTFDFQQDSGSVQLKITQTGVPVGEEELTKSNWNGYYWRAIKATFGFGANF